MSEENNTQAVSQTPKPDPNLKNFEKLIGNWEVSGDLQGTTSYEWMEGEFFLLQRFDFVRDGQLIKGIEIIGHEKGFTGEPSAEIKTRVYSFTDGMTLDYVYEMDGDELTIWLDRKGSDAYMKGKFSNNGRKMDIEWFYPGGGYTATVKRIN